MNSNLKLKDKIYYIDFEESHASYTIVKIDEVDNNIIYQVHSDQLPSLTGYYPLAAESIDNDGDRFFSSPELAHDGYVKFKEKRERKRNVK